MLFEQIKILRPKIDWFMSSLSSTFTTSKLLRYLLQGSDYDVSDGSFYPITKRVSRTRIISTPDGTELIQGGCLLPGNEEDQDPYRSKLGGHFGLVAITTGITLPNELIPTLNLACDGLSVLNLVGINSNKIKARLKHVDLISAINDLLETCTFEIIK